MKRVILVISHLGAGSANLCYCLAQSEMVEWAQDGIIYDHPTESVESLLATKHKYSNRIGLYVNEVLYNYQICHKGMCKTCEFIFLIRDPKNSIKVLKPVDSVFALNYYIFRLRRIYEMAKESKGAIFLTWDDLMNKKGMTLVSKKLNISDLQFKEVPSNRQLLDLPKSLLKEAERAYEFCLYRIRNKAQVLKC